MVIVVVIFRLAVMPRYLTYLNMAYTKLEELKQEAGKVSNVELQKMIARVFYYTTVVSSFLTFRFLKTRLFLRSGRSGRCK